MNDQYLPVQYEYRELIEEQRLKASKGKIFFFSAPRVVDDAEGSITKFEDVPGKGMFVTLDSGKAVRIDKIITLYGKPGPAYDEYEALGNVCLDCTGGYDL